MLRDLLDKKGAAVGRGRGHVATLLKRLRIAALYRKPNTSKPATGHKIDPYLLRGLAIARRGKPEIFHTDPGSQFTSHAFTNVLREAGLAISRDGRGATMSASSACGGRSNTKRSICTPTAA